MDECRRSINGRLMCIGRRRRQICECTLAGLDILPSQHFVLVSLKHMGHAASQKQIAEKMQVSPASVARTIKSLDQDGYITRSGGADGRCNETTITEKGEAVLSHSLELFQQLDARCYMGFSAEEMDLLRNLLDRMLGNLDRIKNEIETEMNS